MAEPSKLLPNDYPIKTPLMNVMVSAVRKAARGLMRDFKEVDHLQVSRKGVVNFVTDADLRAEKTIYTELKKARPKFGFLMEEGGEEIGEDTSIRWVIDPLDGTTNFIHAVPYFSITIAVEKKTPQGQEILAGLVYDPVHDEMYMAEKDKGAFLNHRKLRVANQRIQDFYFVTGTARMPTPFHDANADFTRAASRLECNIRRGGSAALDMAYVAAGRYDACWFAQVQKWDIAAGMLLVKEAGGMVYSMVKNADPYQTGCIIASTIPAYEALQGFVRAESTIDTPC